MSGDVPIFDLILHLCPCTIRAPSETGKKMKAFFRENDSSNEKNMLVKIVIKSKNSIGDSVTEILEENISQ